MSSVSLEKAQRIAELAAERVGLMERLNQIDEELVGEIGGNSVASESSPRRKSRRRLVWLARRSLHRRTGICRRF